MSVEGFECPPSDEESLEEFAESEEYRYAPAWSSRSPERRDSAELRSDASAPLPPRNVESDIAAVVEELGRAEEENAVLRAALEDREQQLSKAEFFAERLKAKVKAQAEELAEVSRKFDDAREYVDLCQRRIEQLDSTQAFPLTERSLAGGASGSRNTALASSGSATMMQNENGALLERAQLCSANDRLTQQLFDKTELSEQLAIDLRQARGSCAKREAELRSERERVTVVVESLRALQKEQRAVRDAVAGRGERITDALSTTAGAADAGTGAGGGRSNGGGDSGGAVLAQIVALRRELDEKATEYAEVQQSWRASVIESEQQRLQISVLEQELRGRAFDFGAPPEQSEMLVELARLKGELSTKTKAVDVLSAQLNEHRLTNEEIEALTSHNVELTRVVEQLSQSESVSEALQSLEAERNMLIRYVENDIPRRIESLEAERDAATRRVEEWRTKHEVQKEAATVRTAAAARQESVVIGEMQSIQAQLKETLESVVLEKNSKLESLESHRAELQQQLETAELAATERLEAEERNALRCEGLEAQVAELRDVVAALRDERERFEAAEARSVVSVEAAQSELKRNMEHVAQLELDSEARSLELQAQVAMNTAHEARIASHSEELEGVRARAEAAATRVNFLEEEVGVRSTTECELVEQTTRSEAQLASLERRKRDLDATVARLTSNATSTRRVLSEALREAQRVGGALRAVSASTLSLSSSSNDGEGGSVASEADGFASLLRDVIADLVAANVDATAQAELTATLQAELSATEARARDLAATQRDSLVLREELERTVRLKSSEAQKTSLALHRAKERVERLETEVTADVELLAEEHRRATMREKDLERTVSKQRHQMDELAQSNAMLERRTNQQQQQQQLQPSNQSGQNQSSSYRPRLAGGGADVGAGTWSRTSDASSTARHAMRDGSRMSVGDLGQQQQQPRVVAAAAAAAPPPAARLVRSAFDDQLRAWEQERDDTQRRRAK